MSEVMSTLRRALFSLGLAAAAVGGLPAAPSAAAQEVTLRVQHFPPPAQTNHKDFIEPWARMAEAQSGGRPEIQRQLVEEGKSDTARVGHGGRSPCVRTRIITFIQQK